MAAVKKRMYQAMLWASKRLDASSTAFLAETARSQKSVSSATSNVPQPLLKRAPREYEPNKSAPSGMCIRASKARMGRMPTLPSLENCLRRANARLASNAVFTVRLRSRQMARSFPANGTEATWARVVRHCHGARPSGFGHSLPSRALTFRRGDDKGTKSVSLPTAFPGSLPPWRCSMSLVNREEGWSRSSESRRPRAILGDDRWRPERIDTSSFISIQMLFSSTMAWWNVSRSQPSRMTLPRQRRRPSQACQVGAMPAEASSPPSRAKASGETSASSSIVMSGRRSGRRKKRLF
mmetsp:Transcript_67891/g.159817  ORF Transcript_67891/g.159817 Transcript_67891/m.159817 type:complete len:295 (+) Transcript_67891:311-1195(+)